MTTQPSINPIDWNWNPTTWGWGFDLSGLLDPAPLLGTLKAMAQAVPHLFDGHAELRLQAAADAHRRLDVSLGKLHAAIDPHVATVLKEWQGPAADEFRKGWSEIVSQKTREELKRSCEGVAVALETVLHATNLTKQALVELVRTAIMWAALFYAFRLAAQIWASYLAYLRSARLVMQAVGLLQRLGALFRTLGATMRALPLVGRLKFVGKLGGVLKQAALRPFNFEAMTKLGNAKFADYAKLTGYVYGGVIGTEMAAQGMKGNSIFNLAPMTFAQAGRISVGATLAGTFVPLAGPFTKGLAQGGTAAGWAATLTKTGVAVGESATAFGSFVAARNWAIANLWSPKWIGRFSPNLQKQLLGAPPTSAFRVWRTLQAPERFDLPHWEAPQAHAGTWSIKNEGSLWDVAQKVYGDGSRWRELYEANRDLIGPDPTVLRTGQVLVIPGK